jgi:hypothetical protein
MSRNDDCIERIIEGIVTTVRIKSLKIVNELYNR